MMMTGTNSRHSLSQFALSAKDVLEKQETYSNIADDARFQGKPMRRYMANVLHSWFFEGLLFLLIFANFILTVRETDMGGSDEQVPPWMGAFFLCCLVLFLVELLLRLWVLGSGFFKDNSNLVDFAIVAIDVLSTIAEPVVGDMPSSSWLRLFRVLRIMRAVRLIKQFRELYVMLFGLISTLRALMWAVVLIFIVLSCCSIVAVEIVHPINKRVAKSGAYEDCGRCHRAFETVMQSNLTFVQQIIAGDSWGQITLRIVDESPWTAIFFIFVLFIVNLGLLNMVLKVIVDQANEARQEDVESRLAVKLRAQKKAAEQLLRVCSDLDTDGNGTLSLEELLRGYDTSPEFKLMMDTMDANADDLPTVFKVLDSDASGDVTYVEFVEQLQKLKSQDSHTLLVFIKCYLTEVKSKMYEQLDIMNSLTKQSNARYDEHDQKFQQILSSMTSNMPSHPKSLSPEESHGDGQCGSSNVRDLDKSVVEQLVDKYNSLEQKLDRIISIPCEAKTFRLQEIDLKEIQAITLAAEEKVHRPDGSYTNNTFAERLCCTPMRARASPLLGAGQVELDILHRNLTTVINAIIQDSMRISHARVLELTSNPDFLSQMIASGKLDSSAIHIKSLECERNPPKAPGEGTMRE